MNGANRDSDQGFCPANQVQLAGRRARDIGRSVWIRKCSLAVGLRSLYRPLSERGQLLQKRSAVGCRKQT